MDIRLPRLHAAFAVDSGGETRQIPRHRHAEAELVLVVRGHISIDVAGLELDGPAGSLHLLPPAVPHSQRCRVPWLTRCLLFTQPEPVIAETPRTLNGDGAALKDRRVRRWIKDLCELSVSPMGDHAVGDALLRAVLGELSQREQQSALHQEMHPQLAVAVAYLHAHLTEDVPLGDIAADACISASHLSALFRRQFGCGPLQYRQRLRLDTARALLRNPYLSVEEVAFRCGYPDPNYFARLFRRVTGRRPSQMRQTTVSQEKSG